MKEWMARKLHDFMAKFTWESLVASPNPPWFNGETCGLTMIFILFFFMAITRNEQRIIALRTEMVMEMAAARSQIVNISKVEAFLEHHFSEGHEMGAFLEQYFSQENEEAVLRNGIVEMPVMEPAELGEDGAEEKKFYGWIVVRDKETGQNYLAPITPEAKKIEASHNHSSTANPT